jgi:hypothetical protein
MQTSWMCRRVPLVRSDGPDERTAVIIRVESISDVKFASK